MACKDCTGGCVNDCAAVCIAACSHDCTGTCSGGCGAACTDGCSSACQRDCSGECWANCYGGCRDNCAVSCTGGCGSSCSNSCSGGCSGCGGACSYGCTSCTGSCSGQCDNGCVAQGKSEAYNSLGANIKLDQVLRAADMAGVQEFILHELSRRSITPADRLVTALNDEIVPQAARAVFANCEKAGYSKTRPTSKVYTAADMAPYIEFMKGLYNQSLQ